MAVAEKAYFNWSGGKDSALALYHTQREGIYRPDLLLTSVNKTHGRVSMHGVRSELLQAQAESLGLPLQTIELTEHIGMEDYNAILSRAVSGLAAAGYRHTVFGDIFLEDLRAYREEQLRPHGITAHFPLWRRDTQELLAEFLDLGFRTIVVCVRGELLDRSWAGREIDRDFVRDLPAGVDPCGENGEFHTFVFDGPVFSRPVPFTVGETVYREYPKPKDDRDSCFTPQTAAQMGFWFCDLLPG